MLVEDDQVAEESVTEQANRDQVTKGTLTRMPSRAMIVVGGGSSSRFGSEKLLADVAGRPLIIHTLETVSAHVDTCVIVCRPDLVDMMAGLAPGVVVTSGGATRTRSEMAGITALEDVHDLVGIHDAARPVVSGELLETLFSVAAERGGAVPVLEPEGLLVDRTTHSPVTGTVRAQTPQVFRGPELVAAFEKAALARFEGHDTAAVVSAHSDLEIVAVPGDTNNVKVTYPGDLEIVSQALAGPSRT